MKHVHQKREKLHSSSYPHGIHRKAAAICMRSVCSYANEDEMRECLLLMMHVCARERQCDPINYYYVCFRTFAKRDY